MESELVTAETERLRLCIDDLARILALPSTWIGRAPSAIVQGLLDSLLSMLGLELVYLRLHAPIGDAPLEAARCGQWADNVGPDEIGAVLSSWLGAEPGHRPPRLPISGQEISVVSLPLGSNGEIGLLVAGAMRAGFPQATERMLLGTAASQATIGLQNARLVGMQEQIDAVARDKEAMLHQLVDSIAAEVTLSTPEGEIVVVNRTCLERTGRPFKGHSDWATGDLLHPDDLPRVKEAWARAVETGAAYEVDVRSLCADGVYRWVHSHGFPIREADGQIFRWCTLHLDINARKEAEAALAASERRFELVTNTIPAMAWSADTDGNVDFFNQHFLDYVGQPLTRMMDGGWKDAVHPEDVERLLGTWKSVMGSGVAGETEARLRRFDGVYRWFLMRINPLRDDTGNVVKWYGVNTDIEDQKRAEHALRASESALAESESKLYQTINTIPAVAWSADVDGRADYFNRHYLDYVGFSAEQAQGWGWIEAVHPDDRPGLAAAWEEVRASGRGKAVEARLRRFDGVYRWFLFRSNALLDETGKVTRWYGVNTDIEDLKRAEEALAASARDLDQIIGTIPGLAWTAYPDGNAEFLNRHYLDYLGLTLEQARGAGWAAAIHPDDREHLVGVWQRMMAERRGGETEARLRRHDGEYRWFLFRTNPVLDGAGNVVRWFGANTDIEDRKRAEEALRASEFNLRRLTEAIPQMLWSATPEGAIDYCNGRLLDYTGLAEADVMRDGWVKMLHPDDRAPTARTWQACVETGDPYTVEVRTYHAADQAYRWLLTTALPLRDAQGRILKWYGACVDMHDWKQAQDELRDTQAELAHMTRVMTMGHLTASIAHELNQPLAGIITNASTCLRMLAAEPPNVAGARETARRTIRDGNRAAEVITRLRALFSKRSTAVEAVDLNTATQEVIALTLTELQRAGVNLRLELADQLPFVKGDRIQLQQVIMNLILNAVEAMEAVTDRAKELVVATERDGSDHVRVVVQDAGVGFDSTTAEKLFNPFYTTKGHGMGIGLSVSRSIVENHQGRLWAKINDGPGATFLVSIPSRPDAGGPAGHP